MSKDNDYISTPSLPDKISGSNSISMGVVLGLFIGYIGLAIGLLIYGKDDKERNNFLIYWIIGCVFSTIITIIVAGVILILFSKTKTGF